MLITKTVVIATFLSSFAVASDQTPDKGFSLDGFEIQAQLWGITDGMHSISGIPASYRTMPTNPEDTAMGWGNKVYIITPDTVQPRTTIASTFSFAWQFKMHKSTYLRLGLNVTPVGLVPYPNPAFDLNNNLLKHSATNEVNVGSGLAQGRGQGTSLVYYTAVTGGSWLPGASMQYEKKISDSAAWVLDTTLIDYRNNIETGWDRFNELTKYQQQNLGTTFVFAETFGVKLGSVSGLIVSAGPAFSFAKMAPNAADAKINHNKIAVIIKVAWFLNKHRD